MPHGRPRKAEGYAAAKPAKRNGGLRGGAVPGGRQTAQELEPSDYKHVVLGLTFLKFTSEAFEAKHAALLAEDKVAAEDPNEYRAENVFWVPKEARWSHLQASAKQPTIGKLLDDAMQAIEASNASLKGVLPKDHVRPALNKIVLGELIDLIFGIAVARRPGVGARHSGPRLRIFPRPVRRRRRQARWRAPIRPNYLRLSSP